MIDSMFVSILGIIILFRVTAHFLDKANIEGAARKNGWKEIQIKWAPFAPGWFFESGERHYRVSFLDKEGNRRQQYCKTGLFTGVFWRGGSA